MTRKTFTVNIHDNSQYNGYSYYNGGVKIKSENVITAKTLRDLRKKFELRSAEYQIVGRLDKKVNEEIMRDTEKQVNAAYIKNGREMYCVVVLIDSDNNLRAIMRHKSNRNADGTERELTDAEFEKMKPRLAESSKAILKTRRKDGEDRGYYVLCFFGNPVTDDVDFSTVEIDMVSRLEAVEAENRKLREIVKILCNKLDIEFHL